MKIKHIIFFGAGIAVAVAGTVFASSWTNVQTDASGNLYAPANVNVSGTLYIQGSAVSTSTGGLASYNVTSANPFISVSTTTTSATLTFSSSSLGLNTAAYHPATDFLSSSTTYVATNTGDWAGTWQTHAPSYFQTALGFTPAHSGANSDITSLSGLTTPLSAGQGGTATTTALGLCAFLSSCGSGLSSYAVSVATANGVSATAATTTTSTALTFSLGAITPSTVNGLALSLGANSISTNVAVGVGALANGSLSGSSNTANGMYSLHSNTTGNYNTANGDHSLFSNTIGNYNTANGDQSLYNNTTGNNNTANGDYSLLNNTTSSNSVALGSYAGRNSTIPNAFYVGNVSQSSAANDQNYSLLYGNFSGVAATTTGQFLQVNGHLGSATSTVSVTSCGTGSPTVTGSDNGGVITAGTVATTCTLNFASKWNYAPSCVVTSRTASIAVGYSVTTSTLTVTNAALGADVIDYHCYGNPN
jgi:hypothetical protein